MTSIGWSAFQDCSGLTNVDLGNSVSKIENLAFVGCSNLSSITIPASVDSIGIGAFAECYALKSITWNAKHCADRYVEGQGFSPIFNRRLNSDSWSANLEFTEVTLGNEVEHLPTYLFIGIQEGHVSEIHIQRINNHISHPTDVSFGNAAFVTSGVDTIYVTQGRVEEYRNADPWKYFNIAAGDWLIPIESISLVETELNMFASSTATLHVVTDPVDPSYPMPNWQSSDTNVVTVDENGLVTAHHVGNATITGTTIDGTGLSVTCEVTVNGTTSLMLNKNETFIYVSNSETLIPTITPIEMASAPLLWQSSNPAVADVDQNGTISAHAVGTATITVSATDGTNLSASCLVNTNYEYGLMADTIRHTRGENATSIEYPVELINTNIVSGLQFEVQLPENVTLVYDEEYADVWLDDARKARDHHIDVTQLGDNHYQFMISSPTNKELKGHDGTLFYMNLFVDQYHNAGIYNINFTNLTLTEADETEHTGLNTSSAVQFNYMLGDADADATVDVADHITTLLHILNRPCQRFYEDAANVHTANPAINVTDLVGIANIALGIRPVEILHAPALDGSMPANDIEPEIAVNVRKLDVDRWMMSIDMNNYQPIAALQLDLQLPDGVTYESANLSDRAGKLQLSDGTLPDGTLRLMVSSFSADNIESSSGEVLNVILHGNPHNGGMASIGNITVAERNLNSYMLEHMTVPFTPTAIDEVNAYNEVRIYGENGCVVIESPMAGTAQLVLINGNSTLLKVEPGRNRYPVNTNEIYIVRFNGTTAKLKF